MLYPDRTSGSKKVTPISLGRLFVSLISSPEGLIVPTTEALRQQATNALINEAVREGNYISNLGVQLELGDRAAGREPLTIEAYIDRAYEYYRAGVHRAGLMRGAVITLPGDPPPTGA